MKTLTEYLIFHTETHRAYVHITPQVEEILRKSGVKEGMVLDAVIGPALSGQLMWLSSDR
jgi:thiamine phosphate synthase YjbQ (UPF0047 family)